MNGKPDPQELGAFLKARRRELSLRAVGLPDCGGRRRVEGLRREEVASLAAISVDYYTRIEQGRVQASLSVLNDIARVLHLDDTRRAQLHRLAGDAPGRRRRPAPQRAHPQLRRLLGELVHTPALVLGRRMDILAWNPPAAALITDFAELPVRKRNYVRLVFTDPALRGLYVDWAGTARAAVAQLRLEAVRDSTDPRLADLVGELSVHDEDFRQWWGEGRLGAHGVGIKVLRHPVAGELTLHWDTLTCPGDPDQQLVTLTAEPGSPSQDGLRILASWTARTRRTPTG
ncbi:helix-turn-helix domain-containing protein [Streptomyces sp. NPDC005573]|uniref:helix-turn-helix domain-containing protein n=1 Tax=Streptomyces sp. NPDC005573 TaxID=3156890 RepID=UPI0033A593A8